MPRTDPPPKPAEPNGDSGVLPASDAAAIGWVDDESIDIDLQGTDGPAGDAEITVGEAELGIDELGLDDRDLDEEDNANERPTVLPPVPEQEYVRSMMQRLSESERVPPSRMLTPPAFPRPVAPLALSALSSAPDSDPPSSDPVSGPAAKATEPPGSVDPISSRPTPIDPIVPLTLDLFETLRPRRAADPEHTGIRERSLFPAEISAREAPLGALSFAPASGDALELVEARAKSIRPVAPVGLTLRDVRDRFDVGDFSGALVLAEGIIEQDPENADVLLLADHCRDTLQQMYVSRLGGMRRVPQVALGQEQLRWLALDHRSGFLLSLVDGRSTFEQLLDISGMPSLEALRMMTQLLSQNVIKVL